MHSVVEIFSTFKSFYQFRTLRKKRFPLFSAELKLVYSGIKTQAFKQTMASLPKKLEFEHLLVLGVGSYAGARYKIGIFEKLRSCATNVYTCDLEYNDLIPALLNNGLVNRFFPVHSLEPEAATEELLRHLEAASIRPDVVVTYRDEWLQARTIVAIHYGLSHPSLEANRISQDKYKTREILRQSGIESISHEVSNVEALPRVASRFGFPFFLKPTAGIRSEWARWISDEQALNQYIESISCTQNAFSKTFLLEEALQGHEVDADIVLYKGNLCYGEISDNFPVYRPFALETGQLTPSILDKTMQEAIVKYAYKAALACGYDRGVLHVELMLKPDGNIVLLEVNGRLGGMYIANWHEDIWSVDLIKAELAISAEIDPAPFLKKAKIPKKALAQLCITTNQDQVSSVIGILEIQGWVNFQDFLNNRTIYHTEEWVPFPYTRDVAINGNANIGEITVEADTPLLAFQKLYALCETCPPLIRTNNGMIQASIQALRRFSASTPGIERFVLREAASKDVPYITEILLFLTKRAQPTSSESAQTLIVPDSTTILVVEDAFSPDRRIIGTVALGVFNRLRVHASKTGFAHDLVVHPNYRKLGIGEALMDALVAVAGKQGISKMDFACEKALVDWYTTLGFSPVGVHMVKYFDDKNSMQPFNREEIARKGEWLYGQDIVSKLLIPHIPEFTIPKHFFIPMGTDPQTIIDEICVYGKSYSVKYSLHGPGAFSYLGKRGANSSRGRKLDILCKLDALSRIKDFMHNAPQNCSGLVLQEFINQNGGCLFHAECSTKSIEVDLLWEPNISTGRAYSLFHSHGKKQIIYEELQGVGSGEPSDRRAACKYITNLCHLAVGQLFNEYGDISWSLEGFWSPCDSKLTVLQLRPTPQDRPISMLRNTVGSVYSTSFTWGDFNVGPLKLQEEADESIFIRKSLSIEALEAVVLKRLSAGKFTLLLDPFNGFCLSHEKWFLPPPHMRKLFGFIHIRQDIIDSLSGRMVRILSSGRRGHLIPIDMAASKL